VHMTVAQATLVAVDAVGGVTGNVAGVGVGGNNPWQYGHGHRWTQDAMPLQMSSTSGQATWVVVCVVNGVIGSVVAVGAGDGTSQIGHGHR